MGYPSLSFGKHFNPGSPAGSLKCTVWWGEFRLKVRVFFSNSYSPYLALCSCMSLPTAEQHGKALGKQQQNRMSSTRQMVWPRTRTHTRWGENSLIFSNRDVLSTRNRKDGEARLVAISSGCLWNRQLATKHRLSCWMGMARSAPNHSL